MNMHLHKMNCKVCKSGLQKEIERDYINGSSLIELTGMYPGFNTQNFWNHFNAFPAVGKKRSENTEKLLDRFLAHGSISGIPIDGNMILRAAMLKLKLQGKLNDNKPLQIINTVIVQQADDKVKNNRIKAHERLFSHVVSDN